MYRMSSNLSRSLSDIDRNKSHSALKFPYLILKGMNLGLDSLLGFCEVYENLKNNMHAHSIR
jgi:hypothetical protein